MNNPSYDFLRFCLVPYHMVYTSRMGKVIWLVYELENDKTMNFLFQTLFHLQTSFLFGRIIVLLCDCFIIDRIEFVFFSAPLPWSVLERHTGRSLSVIVTPSLFRPIFPYSRSSTEIESKWEWKKVSWFTPKIISCVNRITTVISISKMTGAYLI